jgi:Rer1 family
MRRYSSAKAILLGFAATFFAAFDVPVFWPMLLLYWLVLFFLTMKRQIRHMIKHRYVPFSVGKRVRPYHGTSVGMCITCRACTDLQTLPARVVPVHAKNFLLYLADVCKGGKHQQVTPAEAQSSSATMTPSGVFPLKMAPWHAGQPRGHACTASTQLLFFEAGIVGNTHESGCNPMTCQMCLA